MSERRRVVLGTGYAFVGTVVGLLTAIVLRPLMVRFLGIGDYGVLMLSVSLQGIVSMFADLGFGSAVTKFVADERDATLRGQLITVALVASFLSGLVSTGLLIVIAMGASGVFSMNLLNPLLLIAAWQVPFNFGVITCLAALNGLRDMRYYAMGSVANSVIAFLAVLGVLLLGGGVVDVAIATVVSAVLSLVILVFLLRRHLALRSMKGSWPVAMRLAKFGIPLSATNASSTMLYQADTTLVGFFTKSDVLVGYYSIAILFARMLWLLPGSISVVSYSAISEYERDHATRRTGMFVERALRFSAAITGIGLLAIGYFGPEALVFLFGADALASYGPLLILVIGAGMLGVAKSVATGIASAGRPDIGLRVSLIGLVASVVLNVILIPPFGLPGAALATSLSYGFLGVLTVLYVHRLLHTPSDRRWFGEISAWLALLAIPLAFGTVLGDSFAIVRWASGLLALAGFLVLLYIRLIPREDSIFLLETLRGWVHRTRRVRI